MHSIKKIVPQGKNGKLLFYGAAVLLFIFLGSHILKLVKKMFSMVGNVISGETELSNEQNKKAEEDMKQASAGFNYNSLPHPKHVYQAIADGQFSAMQYIGTDFSALMNGVKGLSKRELEAVFYLYGLRQVSTFGQTDSMKKNLLQAYQDELTSYSLFGKSEVEQMQDVWDVTGMKI